MGISQRHAGLAAPVQYSEFQETAGGHVMSCQAAVFCPTLITCRDNNQTMNISAVNSQKRE